VAPPLDGDAFWYAETGLPGAVRNRLAASLGHALPVLAILVALVGCAKTRQEAGSTSDRPTIVPALSAPTEDAGPVPSRRVMVLRASGLFDEGVTRDGSSARVVRVRFPGGGEEAHPDTEVLSMSGGKQGYQMPDFRYGLCSAVVSTFAPCRHVGEGTCRTAEGDTCAKVELFYPANPDLIAVAWVRRQAAILTLPEVSLGEKLARPGTPVLGRSEAGWQEGTLTRRKRESCTVQWKMSSSTATLPCGSLSPLTPPTGFVPSVGHFVLVRPSDRKVPTWSVEQVRTVSGGRVATMDVRGIGKMRSLADLIGLCPYEPVEGRPSTTR
jgi:hypothetical protein